MRNFPVGGARRSPSVSRNPSADLAGGLAALPSGRSGSAGADLGGVRICVKSVDQPARQETRHAAYKAKNTAANILWKQADKLADLGKRISHCRYVPYGDLVTLEKASDRAGFTGLRSCNSVWCCPLCSARISAGRRDELNALLSGARSAGLAVVMLTLTASHKRGMNLPGWLESFKGAKKTFRQRREWRALKPVFVGSVTATEVTHSDGNGFHPHFHELLVFDLPAAAALAAIEGLRSAWLASLAGQGLTGNEHAFQVQPASAAGEYVGKFGAAEELALSHVKQGRGAASRSPWQLLRDAGDCDNPRAARDAMIWAEYAGAFRGRRQLVWSPGLKARFGISDIEDADISDALPLPELLRVWDGNGDGWRAARLRSVALLNAAESGSCLDAAEFGETDAARWRARPSERVIE